MKEQERLTTQEPKIKHQGSPQCPMIKHINHDIPLWNHLKPPKNSHYNCSTGKCQILKQPTQLQPPNNTFFCFFRLFLLFVFCCIHSLHSLVLIMVILCRGNKQQGSIYPRNKQGPMSQVVGIGSW